MKQASLCSGFGGFDIAAEWMGWDNVFNCEIDTFCRKILKYYWPQAIQYGDVRTTDFTIWRGRVDVLSAGFPCQPFSAAGKRQGTADERHLWPEVFRAVREIRPRWFVGENVLGITNWNGGLVFEQVCADLEAEGYEVQPYVLPACGVDAPHQRYRTWFIAYSNLHSDLRGTVKDEGKSQKERLSERDEIRKSDKSDNIRGIVENPYGDGRHDNKWKEAPRKREQWDTGTGDNEWLCDNPRTVADTGSEQLQDRAQNCVTEDRTETGTGLDYRAERLSDIEITAHSDGAGFQKTQTEQQATGITGDSRNITYTEGVGLQRFAVTGEHNKKRAQSRDQQSWRPLCPDWRDFPTQPPVCSRNDGISYSLDGITFSKWRQESIKGFGNAIVPQVAYQIFKAINEYENKYNI